MINIPRLLSRKRSLLMRASFGLTLLVGFITTNISHAEPSGLQRMREPSEQKLTFSNLPDLPEALSGAFTGSLGKKMIVAGGSRENSMEPSSFSDRIYIYDPDTAQWDTAKLPLPMAFGSCATTSKALYLVGGLTPEGVSRKVLKVTFAEQGTSKLAIEEIMELPFPLTMSSAAVLDNKLMVAGGISSLEPADIYSY